MRIIRTKTSTKTAKNAVIVNGRALKKGDDVYAYATGVSYTFEGTKTVKGVKRAIFAPKWSPSGLGLRKPRVDTVNKQFGRDD